MIPLKEYSRGQEMDKIKEMLEREELKLRTIERWVLGEYYRSLQNDNNK
jgi:hypothetical protein